MTEPIIIDSNVGLPSWFNSGFIISICSLIGGGITMCLRYFLKSRCTTIKCFCFECNRDVIPSTDLNEVTISTPPPVTTQTN
jgi:hypothetical protein